SDFEDFGIDGRKPGTPPTLRPTVNEPRAPSRVLPRLDTASILGGSILWVAWGLGLAATDWMATRVFATIEWLTLLGPLVVVPLGLPLLRAGSGATPVASDEDARPPALLVRALPLGAACALASMVVDDGPAATGLAGGWALVTWLVARQGTQRLRSRTPRGLPERCADMASAYLFVGGVTWVVARSGARPFGLTEPIVTLATTHFHFAGFALLAATAEVGRRLGASHGTVAGPVRTAWVIGAWLVLVSPAFVALGITASPPLEVLASCALATGGFIVGLSMAFVVTPRIPRLWPAAFVAAGGLALCVGMGAAAVFAVGQHTGDHGPSTATMVPLHAVPNALFFGLGGLLGLRWARTDP
ncbi:MAG: YndJ family transporter, partial [Myxococcota bacterium]